MNSNAPVKWLCAGILLLCCTNAHAQCRSDMDCKGERICESGACVSPATAKGSTKQPAVSKRTETAASPSAPIGPCTGVDCSGQGNCTVVENAPRCTCNAGYQADSTGKQCLELPPLPGTEGAASPVTSTAVLPQVSAPVENTNMAQPIQQAQPEVEGPHQNTESPTPLDNNSSTTRKKRLAAGHVFFWSGLALAGFGGISTGVALSAANEYNKTFRSDDESRARAFTGLMWTGYISGLTFMTMGIIMWATAPDKAEQKVALLPAVGQNEFGLTLTGRW
ncbi:MAG: hypothetical protein JXX29_14465 [Deltaproteobacteria bacterium]|nr:hypothetical protein [Deltaproteobacteria bacterium]MBN2672883.1 hypothetical protein [Deltaproteobacteria bacterium]